jgi:hypothetical protein
MKHLQSDVNHLDLQNNLSNMESKNDVGVFGKKGKRVRTKDGIEFTIVDDMTPSKLTPSMKKKFASIDEKLKKAGLPNFPPYED